MDRETVIRIKESETVFNSVPGVVIIHHIHNGTVVYMSDEGLNMLGTTIEALQQMDVEYYSRFFNLAEASEYVPKILGMLERNNDDETVSYYQQVRSSPAHEWVWYLSATKIYARDSTGKPLLTITTSIPVDTQHSFSANVERLVKENEFLRRNKHLISRLTNREKEVLVYIAKGSSSLEIAEEMNLAEDTVKTHRRNIKRKINAQNHYDIVYFAQAFGLI